MDTFESRYQDESGMYCGFFIHVLMCTAYTNLANTFLISFLSKNSDLSSMLEAYMIYSLSRLIFPVSFYLFENNNMCKQRAFSALASWCM